MKQTIKADDTILTCNLVCRCHPFYPEKGVSTFVRNVGDYHSNCRKGYHMPEDRKLDIHCCGADSCCLVPMYVHYRLDRMNCVGR
jgi:hypothetical protein